MLPPCAGSLRLPPSALLPPAGCAVDALPLLPPLADEPPTSALLGSPPLAAPGFDAPWPEHAARSAANTSGTRARCPVVIALHSSALISRGRVKHPVSFHSRVRRFLTRFASSLADMESSQICGSALIRTMRARRLGVAAFRRCRRRSLRSFERRAR